MFQGQQLATLEKYTLNLQAPPILNFQEHSHRFYTSGVLETTMENLSKDCKTN